MMDDFTNGSHDIPDNQAGFLAGTQHKYTFTTEKSGRVRQEPGEAFSLDGSAALWSLKRIFEEAIGAMGQMMEVRDPYTAGHQERVSCICAEIAGVMDLTPARVKGLRLAALIHDIGKLAIPSELLSKPGRLNQAEFDLIKTHPTVGYGIVKDIEFPWPIARIILQHHERMNGTGYPAGLRGLDILLEARILGVADVIEAMSSHRPYRPAIGVNLAIEEIRNNKNSLYDENVVEACLKCFTAARFNLN
jgi:putative nucleotidyltransferase with HDIG domain